MQFVCAAAAPPKQITGLLKEMTTINLLSKKKKKGVKDKPRADFPFDTEDSFQELFLHPPPTSTPSLCLVIVTH